MKHGRLAAPKKLSHDRTVRTCFRTGPDIPDMIPDTIPDTIGHSYRT